MSQEAAGTLGAATREKELKLPPQKESWQGKVFAYSIPLGVLLHPA